MKHPRYGDVHPNTVLPGVAEHAGAINKEGAQFRVYRMRRAGIHRTASAMRDLDLGPAGTVVLLVGVQQAYGAL